MILAASWLLAWPALASEAGIYGYVAAIDGAATSFTQGTAARSGIEPSQPVLVGDRIWSSPQSRLLIHLADGNRLTLDGDTEIVLSSLANSPDTELQRTEIRLNEGRLIVRVADDWLGDEPPRIDTPNATIYLQKPGVYVVTSDRYDSTELTIREGAAEVVTAEGSSVLHTDDRLTVTGDRWPDTRLDRAGLVLPIERWALDQDRLLAQGGDPYLEEPLRHRSDQLNGHGEWVVVGGTRAWRPRVAASWRPYWYGRWAYTPTGLFWVSYDPWASFTFHYGSWDFDAGLGWHWYPGYGYSTASVYWYWGADYVGWVPSGYYHRYYGPRAPGYGFSFGVHGYVGGSWAPFQPWVFCPTRYFGRPQHHRYHHGGYDLQRFAKAPRGLLASDTRGLTPGRWQQADYVRGNLEARAGADLPDVSSFVARRPDLPAPVAQRVLVPEGGRPRTTSPPTTRSLTATPNTVPIVTRTTGTRSISSQRPTAAGQPRTPETPRSGTDRLRSVSADRSRPMVTPPSPPATTATRPTTRAPGSGVRTITARPDLPPESPGTGSRPRSDEPLQSQPRVRTLSPERPVGTSPSHTTTRSPEPEPRPSGVSISRTRSIERQPTTRSISSQPPARRIVDSVRNRSAEDLSARIRASGSTRSPTTRSSPASPRSGRGTRVSPSSRQSVRSATSLSGGGPGGRAFSSPPTGGRPTTSARPSQTTRGRSSSGTSSRSSRSSPRSRPPG